MRKLSGERGSITVFFCFFVLVIVGAISYSLYVGQQVERRIHLQNTSDAAVIAMANHGANGLNMIAANNLAIGASIHISGSVVVLSSYLSVVRALTYGIADVISDVASFFTGGVTKIQSDVWNNLAIVPGLYMRTAAGLTTFNAFIRDYWLYLAPLRSIETARLNVPGSLVIPMQKSRMIPVLATYGGIKQSEPRETVCHAIKSSEAVPEEARDSFIRWMQGPLLTFGDSGIVNGINGVLSVLATVHEKVSSITGIKIGFVNCGYGLKAKLFDSMNMLAGFITKGAPESFMTNVQAPMLIKEAWGEVGLDIGDYTHYEFLLPIVDPRFGLYEAQKEIRIAAVLVQAATFDGDLAKRVALAKMLKGIAGTKQKMKCQARDAQGHQVGGSVLQAIPYKDATGAVTCIKAADVKWYCPLRPEIEMPLGSNIALGDDHNDKVKEHCKGFDAFANSQPGLPIADWGEMAKNYADSSEGGVSSEVRKKSLGFLFPDPAHLDDFKNANTFLNAVTNPLRTPDEIKTGSACAAGFETKLDDRSFCENMPLMGFTNLFEKASREAMSGRKAGDVNLQTGGMDALLTKRAQGAAGAISAQDGALQGTFARLQWVASQSEAYYKAGANDPAPAESMQLFWPAWKTRLRPVSLLSDLIDFVGGQSPAKGAMKNAAQLESDG